MLTIPVWDLLNSYDGDSKNFSFDGPIFDGFFEDISFLENLQFSIKLISIDNGIHAIFSKLTTTIFYNGKKEKISLHDFEREWKTRTDPLEWDDIHQINIKNMTIDLAPVIREELIMAFYNQNL